MPKDWDDEMDPVRVLVQDRFRHPNRSFDHFGANGSSVHVVLNSSVELKMVQQFCIFDHPALLIQEPGQLFPVGALILSF